MTGFLFNYFPDVSVVDLEQVMSDRILNGVLSLIPMSKLSMSD